MSDTPIRAIVTRFSPDHSFATMEQVLQERPFTFCGIISSGQPRYWQAIPRDQQEWFVSSDIRSCTYAGVDWNDLAPLDEELIENMRHCETVFMDLVTRLEWRYRIPYDVRQEWYQRHLRFWNDYLTRHDINLFVSAWLPHEIPDVVIYYLCKLRDIPTLYFHMSTERDCQFSETDITASATQVRDHYQVLLEEYGHITDPKDIPVRDEIRERFIALTAPKGQKPALQSVKLPTYWGDVWQLLVRKPAEFLRAAGRYLTPQGWFRVISAWQRGKSIREREAFYRAHTVEPDFKVPFVYMGLHFQPEASTTPMAGVFSQQVLMAQLLNALLPNDVLIYVKEHPRQSSWVARSPEYYQEFLELKKVRLIAPEVDTFQLREHCQAVATATGSIGFEALFREKPVFMFGHRFYQYARGVHLISTVEDMKAAVQAVFDRQERPSLAESLLYLKAMDETCVHGTLNPWDYQASHLSDEEHIAANSAAILQELAKLVP